MIRVLELVLRKAGNLEICHYALVAEKLRKVELID